VRMTHRATVRSRRDPCVTRRNIVDVLIPRLSNLGLKERGGLEGDRGSAEDWLLLASVVAPEGPSSEGAGGSSRSAGWRAGTTVS
jgi:hypothetical protein